MIFPRFDRVHKAEIYSIKEGKGSAWQKSKKSLHENSKKKRCGLLKLQASRSRRRPANWASLTPLASIAPVATHLLSSKATVVPTANTTSVPTTANTPISTTNNTSASTTVPYPSYSDAEVAIKYYYANGSDFKGKNIIQNFDTLTYNPQTGPVDQPQFLACAHTVAPTARLAARYSPDDIPFEAYTYCV